MDFIASIKEASNLGCIQLNKLQGTFTIIMQTKTKYMEALRLASSNMSSMESKDISVNSTLSQYSQSLLFNSNLYATQLNKVEVEVIEALQVFKENYESVSRNVLQSVDGYIISIEKSKMRNEKLYKSICALISELDCLFLKFQENNRHCSSEHVMKFDTDLKSLDTADKNYQLAIV